MQWKIPSIEQSYDQRDVILYALSVGYGSDPADPKQISFVYEKELQTLPSMALVLATPGSWLRDPATGVDQSKVVHGEQWLTLHKPLPTQGRVRSRSRVIGIADKGPKSGAVIYVERLLSDSSDGSLYASSIASLIARGDGGFGGSPSVSQIVHLPAYRPAAPRDQVVSCDVHTNPAQALIFRLNGDYNPLHSDPAVAAAAGFSRPILHGLCTLGLIEKSVVQGFCAYETKLVSGLQIRFAGFLYPGETLRIRMHRNDGTVFFEAMVVEREEKLIAQGSVQLNRWGGLINKNEARHRDR
ncbi:MULTISPECIES: MaoC/PaaZ C-terminal domain-containing protein [unclassified Variovorax]|uniref:MaoC/PaaZ C-terminal domain-containing protein n=1 Tax=unclassified Variovorax TaxID=663243 RepID=UPI00139224BF|nr:MULTISPECIES: MaoC/PaaZ C-terminal domain-containing protein [unclassified Variovorax]